MKQLQCNFTTPEQSKRLLELGVPACTADCYYTEFGKIEIKNTALDTLYPTCWSVGRLIEIYSIITGRKEFTLRTVDTLINEVIYMLNVAIKHEEFDFSKLEE